MLPFIKIAIRIMRSPMVAPRIVPFIRPAASFLPRRVLTAVPRIYQISGPIAKRLGLPSTFANRAFSTTHTPYNIYNRYRQTRHIRSALSNIYVRWSSRPTFYLEVGTLGAGAGSFYYYNLEVVPVSGRRRFNVISTDFEQQIGESQYQQITQEYQYDILPDNDPRVRQVRRVLSRLIPHSGLPADYDWKATVIDSPETNAFVIPGGKVFVFTGILPVCADDDGLAAVLGHEIGHNVARHIAEQMSRGIFLVAAAWIFELLYGIPGAFSQQLLQLAIDRPRSRAQESEADHIGLMMMAKSCYDPKAAVGLWGRMQEVEKAMGGSPPELLSTHPSSARRQIELEELLPQAVQLAMESECHIMTEQGGFDMNRVVVH